MKRKNMIVVTTKIREDLYKTIKKIAVEEEKTVIEIIEEALEKWLNERQKME